MKRFIAAVLLVVICFGFTGCNYILGESDTLLQAPRPDGTLQKIQQALKESSVKDGYKLKCAKSGDYRSAYIIKDINGNGVDEALAFYAVTEEKQQKLHFAVLKNNEGEWQVASTSALGGTDIECIDFVDLNGDGTEEVVIAWNIYNAPETRLSVFDLSRATPKGIFEESYTSFCIYDINADNNDDLLLFTIDTIEKNSRCTMYTSNNGSIQKHSEVYTDKNATGYKNIRRSAVDGKPALFLDILLGEGGMFTEIITYENGRLRAPLYDQSKQSSLVTLRYQAINCGDADGDGVVEIPGGTVLPSGNNTENALSLTEWKQYSGGLLTVKERSIISGALQYKFRIDEAWLGKFTCIATDSDGMAFYEYSTEQGFGKEIFGLCAVSAESYDKDDYNDWFIVSQNYKTVFLGKLVLEDNPLAINKKTIKKYFSEKIVEEG